MLNKIVVAIGRDMATFLVALDAEVAPVAYDVLMHRWFGIWESAMVKLLARRYITLAPDGLHLTQKGQAAAALCRLVMEEAGERLRTKG